MKFTSNKLVSKDDEITHLINTDSKLLKRKKLRSPWFKLLIVVQIVTLILAGYFFIQYLQEKQKTTLGTGSDQVSQVKLQVGKLIKLETDAEPTVATIKDIASLKAENADFYKDGINGDILLIYPKRAILYDPIQNIIVNVAPIINNTDTTVPTTSVAPTTTVPTTVVTTTSTTKK